VRVPLSWAAHDVDSPHGSSIREEARHAQRKDAQRKDLWWDPVQAHPHTLTLTQHQEPTRAGSVSSRVAADAARLRSVRSR